MNYFSGVSILPGAIGVNSNEGLKICIYREDGTKVIDKTTVRPTANTLLTTNFNTEGALTPGNYYIAVGCVANTCNALTLTAFASTAVAFENGAAVPAGKNVYEGTTTMVAGTCNPTITPTTSGITGAANSTVNARLDE
jgi:uncharacterized protein YqfA (UPF0365 family)